MFSCLSCKGKISDFSLSRFFIHQIELIFKSKKLHVNHSVARIFKKFERVKNLNDENLKSASLANGQAQSRKISKKLRLILVGYYIVYLLFLFLNDFGV